MDRHVVERRDQIKQMKYPSYNQLFEDFIDPRYGKLTGC